MKIVFLTLMTIFLVGCSTLSRASFAAGGAAAGSLLGPGGAAAGAAGGVIAADLMGAGGGSSGPHGPHPQGPTASAFDEAAQFLSTLGWWYLIIFILVPLFTKKGRSWIAKLATLHNTATKKDVDLTTDQLNKLEGMISSITEKGKQ